MGALVFSMKRIGITQRLFYGNHNDLRECLNLEWGMFLKSKHILPLPLSYGIDFVSYIDLIDGVIFSGGNDLSSISNNDIDKIRDDYEDRVMDYCLQFNISLFSVCRGTQKIAQNLGANIIPHSRTKPHKINILDSKLQEIVGAETIVNAYYNYSIQSIKNRDVEILAVDDEGYIQAFRYKNILSCMWHVERGSELLFNDFLESLEEK